MTTDFSALNLDSDLVQRTEELGYETPTEVQERVIPLMLEKKDVIAQSQTGSGKTAAFALPILQKIKNEPSTHSIRALVVTPTRELAIQVADAFRQYGIHLKLEVMAIYGGQHYASSKKRIKHGIDIIVGTPGRLLDLISQKILDLSEVETVILDEADEMLSMGFIEDVEKIMQETSPSRQTSLFSATMPNPIRKLADKYMFSPQLVAVKRKQLTVASVSQRYYLVNEKDKLAALTRVFEMEEITSALIFTRTKVSSGQLANELIQRGFPAEALNGDLAQDARMRVLNRFRAGQIQVLVATDVAARGLDIDDISHVFNFDLPTDQEAYVHRIGRTGRAGKEGTAISFVTPGETHRLQRIERYTKQPLTLEKLPDEEDILKHREESLVEKLSVWLERGRCKREQEIIEAMMADGHDPVKLAASALKMARSQDKQRPIEKVSPLEKGGSGRNVKRTRSGRKERPQRQRKERAPRKRSADIHTQEDGMVRLVLKRGRKQGINPGEVVGTIAGQANIPGDVIGKIMIQDQHTYVDVQKDYISRVLGKTGAYQFRDDKSVVIEKA